MPPDLAHTKLGQSVRRRLPAISHTPLYYLIISYPSWSLIVGAARGWTEGTPLIAVLYVLLQVRAIFFWAIMLTLTLWKTSLKLASSVSGSKRFSLLRIALRYRLAVRIRSFGSGLHYHWIDWVADEIGHVWTRQIWKWWRQQRWISWTSSSWSQFVCWQVCCCSGTATTNNHGEETHAETCHPRRFWVSAWYWCVKLTVVLITH